MKVSIIVPVYNVKKYLRKCLDSLVNQTLQDIEIIVVDDGSTDGSGDFVDSYAIYYPSLIKVIHKENGGLMSAWTTGVRASQGDYIGFVDSDDSASLDMYEKLYRYASDYDVDVVISNYLIDGKIKGFHPIAEGKYEGEALNKTIKEHIFPSFYTYGISMSRMPKLYRRNIIIDNLKYTACLSKTFEDRYIMPAAILSAQSIYYTSDAYYNWMMREGSNHSMYKTSLLDDIKRVYNVQHQVVQDKYPALEEKWEEAYMDFIRLYVFRNIIRVKDIQTKIKSAKVLLSDELTRTRLDKYGCRDKSKMFFVIMWAYRLKCPTLLALFSVIASKKG
jgi:glycosyltransferase involved in cell wall biosynthesis